MNGQVYVYKASPQIAVWASKISLHGRHMFSFITKSPCCNPVWSADITSWFEDRVTQTAWCILAWCPCQSGQVTWDWVLVGCLSFHIAGKKQLDVPQSCEHVPFSWHCVTMRHVAQCSNLPQSQSSLFCLLWLKTNRTFGSHQQVKAASEQMWSSPFSTLFQILSF